MPSNAAKKRLFHKFVETVEVKLFEIIIESIVNVREFCAKTLLTGEFTSIRNYWEMFRVIIE